METQLIETQGVNATFKVTVPAGEVDAAFDRVVRELARSVKVPGFRPGHAPRGVLERRVGRETLEDEVKDTLVDSAYPDAVRELELTPVHAHFHSDAPKEGEPFTFEVHAELYPEVELPELSEIVIDARPREVDDAMIDEAVEQLRNENATLVPVDRSAEGTDYVVLEMLPRPEEAGDGHAAAGQGEGGGSVQPVDMETASEEVRGQLMGKSIGDIVDLALSDTAEQAEEGAEPPKRTLRVLVKDVKAKEKPEPDDDFAKTLGLDSWVEAREEVAKSLRSQLDREAFETQREELIDKLLEATPFDVPESLVRRRSQSLLGDLADDLGQQGVTLESYMQQLEEKGGLEDFEKELQEAAVKSVRRDLVLERLQEQRGTDVSDEEFDEAVRYMARRRRQDPARFRREMGERWLTNYRFLLARDKALRETVRELVAAPADRAGAADAAPDAGADEEEAARAYEEAAEGADGEDEDEAETLEQVERQEG
ncbi:MAG TPA: trigger factor [Trueperaceae bacterium]|nr:trigger factor [Trueperaceae bacterium]